MPKDSKNKYGLDRYIPADIKHQIRVRSSFGCVICGEIPCDYDHLRIPFHEAKIHDPEDMVLLCTKCHSLKTKSIIDIATIEEYVKNKKAAASETRFKLPFLKQNFYVNWCGTKIESARNAFEVDNRSALSFKTTENDLEPLLISGSFTDISGNVICQIEDNAFVTRNDFVGDIQLIGNNFSYKLPDGQKCLEFALNSQSIEIIKAYHTDRDAFIYGQNGELLVGNFFNRILLVGVSVQKCDTAISIGCCTESPHFSYEFTDMKTYMKNANRIINAEMCGNHVGIGVEGKKYPVINTSFKSN